MDSQRVGEAVRDPPAQQPGSLPPLAAQTAVGALIEVAGEEYKDRSSGAMCRIAASDT